MKVGNKLFKKIYLIQVKLVILIVLINFNNCLSVASMQTANTVPPGKIEGVLGGGYFFSDDQDKYLDEIYNGRVDVVTDADSPIQISNFLSIRYGIVSNFDIGFQLLGSGFGTDFKYKIDGKKNRFSFATGFHYTQFNLYPCCGGVSNAYDYDIHNFIVPFYISHKINQYFELYNVSKLNYRLFRGTSKGFTFLLSDSLGCKIGNYFGLIFEVNYQKDLLSKLQAFELDIAVFAHNY